MDSDAMTAFVRVHGPRMTQYAYMLTHDRGSAEDLVQDSLLQAHRRWSGSEFPAYPYAYMRRAILNAYLGRERRRRIFPSHVERPPHAFEDVAAERDHMWRLLGELSSRQRAALVLRYYEDLSDSQIAEVLGCRPATVRSLIARGLEVLRKISAASVVAGTAREEAP